MKGNKRKKTIREPVNDHPLLVVYFSFISLSRKRKQRKKNDKLLVDGQVVHSFTILWSYFLIGSLISEPHLEKLDDHKKIVNHKRVNGKRFDIKLITTAH